MKRLLTAVLAVLMLFSVTASADAEQPAPLFEASFLQGWLCRDWTAERFAQELRDMKAAGFRALILQSTVDLTYVQTEADRPKTDPDAFAQDSAYALYPTALVSGSEQAHALEYALEAAEQTGMQIWIGLVNDGRWWNYGWGEPDADTEKWLSGNAADHCTVIREIRSLYGERYASQIAGFYWTNEYWNIEAEYAEAYAGQYARQLKTVRSQLAESFPAQRLMLSPFYNTALTDRETFCHFLTALVRGSGLRQTDIIALQDGAGRGYDAETIRAWTADAARAVANEVTVWVNNETCTPALQAVPVGQLRDDYLATQAAARHILFSWNHYYHGTELETAYTQMLRGMAGDVNADGQCDRSDVLCVCGMLRGEAPQEAVNWSAADLDGSGSLDAADLTGVKRLLLRQQAANGT